MIPAELCALPQWVCWRLEHRDGKPTKVPYIADQSRGLSKASSTNAATWRTFSESTAALNTGRYSGIGFVFNPEDPYTGIDLDHCRTEDGITSWAQRIVDRMQSYTEWSPSGEGLHIFIKASMNGHDRKRRAVDEGGVELYDQGRYFTVTGRHFDGSALTIREAQADLDELLTELFPPQEIVPRPVLSIVPRDYEFRFGGSSGGPMQWTDAQLIDRAMRAFNGAKFSALWNGDSTSYISGKDPEGKSTGDYALLGLLAFWTNNDADRIESLFRQSQRVREKHDTMRGGVNFLRYSINRIVAGRASGYGNWRIAEPVDDVVEVAEHGAAPVPFPVDALPDAFREYVSQGASALPCPPEFIAVPLLALAGAAIGPARKVVLQSGWTEGTNLYAAVVGKAGTKKTPALKLASAPYVREQKRLLEEFTRKMNNHLLELEEWDKLKKEKPSEAGKKPTQPQQVDIYSSNTTVEQMREMLAKGRGLAYVLDELAAWVTSFNQYKGGRGSDRQSFLSWWSGIYDKNDRKSTKEGAFSGTTATDDAALTVIGGVQPDVFPNLAASSTFDDGFLDRILWAWPTPPKDRYTGQGVEPGTIEAVNAIFRTLFEIGAGEQKFVRSGFDAERLFTMWYTQHIEQKESPSFSGSLEGTWSKMPAQALRLALILHVCEEPESLVLTPDILERAFDLAEYFCLMASRVFAALDSKRDSLRWKLLAGLDDIAPDEINETEINRRIAQGNYPAAEIRSELQWLEQRGFVASRQVETPRGRKPTYWRRLGVERAG